MKRNMRAWKDEVIAGSVKKPMPILTFPVIQLLGITVKELISDSETQAKAMKLLADRNDSLAAVSMMDLSLEAESFGAEILVNDDEELSEAVCLCRRGSCRDILENPCEDEVCER